MHIIWFTIRFTYSRIDCRWYISGHAPWSNYDIIYIACFDVFGLAFDRKSKLTVASSALDRHDFICL
jgi:hypothetical protein